MVAIGGLCMAWESGLSLRAVQSATVVHNHLADRIPVAMHGCVLPMAMRIVVVVHNHLLHKLPMLMPWVCWVSLSMGCALAGTMNKVPSALGVAQCAAAVVNRCRIVMPSHLLVSLRLHGAVFQP